MIRLAIGGVVGFFAAPFLVGKIAPTQTTLSPTNVKVAGAIAGVMAARYL